MKSPLVSIIIPVYNAEKYLEFTVKSAINQTWTNTEILIIDDGSTDRSLIIAEKFYDSRITIFHQQNKGSAAARNKGIIESKGDYIQFLDADDLLSPNKIKAQLEKLNGSKDRVGICDTVYFTEDSNPESFNKVTGWYSNDFEDPVDFLIKLYGGRIVGPQYGGMIQPNAWLTPRTLIDKAGPWDETITVDDDGEFFCRVLLASLGITYSPEAINYYRKLVKPGKSLSGRKDEQSLSSTLKSTDLKAQNLLKHVDTPLVKTVLSRLYYENASNFFPRFPGLVREAEKKARELAPEFHYNPLEDKSTVVRILSNSFGWKTVKYLQHLKQQIIG